MTIFSAAILFCVLNSDNSICENVKEFPSAVGHEADFDTQMYWKDFPINVLLPPDSGML